MDDYLRDIQYWLRTELAIPRKVLDAIWDAGLATEPVIPQQRGPLDGA